MSLMNPKFKYVPASETDVAKTFARIRKQQAQAEAAKTEPKVRQIRAPKKAGS